jgi:hypothetical protein
MTLLSGVRLRLLQDVEKGASLRATPTGEKMASAYSVGPGEISKREAYGTVCDLERAGYLERQERAEGWSFVMTPAGRAALAQSEATP